MASKSTTIKLTLKITSFTLRLLMNIVFYVLAIVLIVNFSRVAYDFTYQLYGPVAMEEAPGRDIQFQINRGESTMDIASKLQVHRAIKNRYAFYTKVKLEDVTIMPGRYNINSSMTYSEIISIISDYSKSTIIIE